MKNEEKNQFIAKLYGITFAISTLLFFSIFFLAGYYNKFDAFTIILLSIAIILFIINALVCIKFDHEVGSYECPDCHTKFVSNYMEMITSTHMGKCMRLRCPKCNKKVWAKKSYEDLNEKEKRS